MIQLTHNIPRACGWLYIINRRVAYEHSCDVQIESNDIPLREFDDDRDRTEKKKTQITTDLTL